MNTKEKDQIIETICKQGFDETLSNYIHIKMVKDRKFHELRLNYIRSVEELEEYLGLKR